MKIAREEIFGPVLSVIPYDGEDERGRDRQRLRLRPLRLGVDRRTSTTARRSRPGCAPGTVAINSSMILDFNGPFGGFKQSGIGRELGPEGIAPYTELQTIILPL